PRFSFQPDQHGVIRAVAFLRKRPVHIEPRRRWDGSVRRGNIDPVEVIEPGRALSYLSDPGWGRMLLSAKHSNQQVPDEMIAASTEFIKQWLGNEIRSIVYVPSI